METLQLKYLAPYLPYGLRMISMNYFEGDEIPWVEWNLCSLSTDGKDSRFDEWWNDEGDNFCLTDGFKPVLHPLTDLTKEIEVNGEKFVPYVELLRECNFDVDNMPKKEIEQYKPTDMEIEMIQSRMYVEIVKLFEWHFDVFGLIEKGLAIDINTL